MSRKFKILRSYNFDTSKMYKNNILKKIIRKKTNKNINSVFLFSSVVPLAFKEMKKKFKNTKYKIYEVKDFNLKKLIKHNKSIDFIRKKILSY